MVWNFLKAVVYGIVEGITEWLPISSTGHLILLEKILPFENVSDAFMEMFDVVIQLGAILAVVVLFFHKLNPFSPKKDATEKKSTWMLWLKVIVAVIPSAVIGLFLDDWLDEHFYNYIVVSVTLILYGIAFIVIERVNRKRTPTVQEVTDITWKLAILIGCFQVLALIPGTSRSGATILGAIILGVSRSAASEFSFFLAIPTMLGASALKVVKFLLVDKGTMSGSEWGILAIASVVAFGVSMVAIKGLMAFVKKHSFSAFGIYRIALGIIVLLLFLLIL